MTRRQSFTPAAIDGLREGKMNHPEVAGLAIYATGSGRSARKTWRYQRRIAKTRSVFNATLGTFPAFSIGDAREWAEKINEAIEAGRDPNATSTIKQERKVLTVDEAHALYIKAVETNKHRARKTEGFPVKPRTLADKRNLYKRNVRPHIGSMPINDVKPDHINRIIVDLRDRTERGVTANRTGAEMNVFFKWCQSLVAIKHGIKFEENPTRHVGELWMPERLRTRALEMWEIEILLRALAEFEEIYRRPIILWLLTGCRLSEITKFEMSDYQDGNFVIRSDKSKNHREHPIALGAWGRALMPTDGRRWLNPSYRADDRPFQWNWPEALDRVRKVMIEQSGREIERFVPHDLRRTFRTHIDDLVDDDVAERMMNHSLGGLVRRYNRNKRAASMAAGFDAWDRTLQDVARRMGVAERLGVPAVDAATPSVA